MSTLGKVLAILNVLAAIGFLCLAGFDYGARQAWMFAVRQQDFILKGLPVDDKELDVDGRPLVNSIGKRMQQQLFTGLSGEPVKTLQTEVERRYKALLADINQAANAEGKKTIIEGALVPLTRTWGQREELQRKIRDPKGSVDALLAADGPFEAPFKEALEGKTVADEQLGLDERRQAMAHLLFNLSHNPEDRRRTLAVVGLAAYTREVDSQATALLNMVPQIQHAMEADLTAFEVEHKGLIEQIEVLADRVRELDRIQKKQLLLAQQHATQVAARKAVVQGLSTEIDAAKKATDLALKGQSRLEDALFHADQAVAAAEEKNQQLLQQMNTLELGR